VLCGSVGQQNDKVFCIGFLDPSNASGNAVFVDVFRQELRKLGWVEGKNISIQYRLPGIYGRKEYVDEGGLMSYGSGYDEEYRKAACYVDRILKGAKPADLCSRQRSLNLSLI
jgi:hypothetical protein